MIAAHHQDLLDARAVPGWVADLRGYRTITDPAELRREGFSPKQATVTPGLLIPRWSLAGRPAIYPQFRPDRPRRIGDHVAKYELPAGAFTSLDVLPDSLAALRDGAECWVSCEGHLKSDSMRSAGAPATVALVGVSVWKTENTHPAWEALVKASPGRWFNVVADSDFQTTVDVSMHVSRLAVHLDELGAPVRVLHPPGEPGHKCGVDDHLAAGGSLDDLVEVAWTVVQLAARSNRRGPHAYGTIADENGSSGWFPHNDGGWW